MDRVVQLTTRDYRERVRMAILRAAIRCHGDEGMKRLRDDLFPDFDPTSPGLLRRLIVDVPADVLIAEDPTAHRAKPLRFDFSPDEVRCALALEAVA